MLMIPRLCNDCQHFGGNAYPVGPCVERGYLVVASLDAAGCTPFSDRVCAAPARSVSEDGRSANAANSSFFGLPSDRRKNHQRRSSTADESGLPDYGV